MQKIVLINFEKWKKIPDVTDLEIKKVLNSYIQNLFIYSSFITILNPIQSYS